MQLYSITTTFSTSQSRTPESPGESANETLQRQRASIDAHVASYSLAQLSMQDRRLSDSRLLTRRLPGSGGFQNTLSGRIGTNEH